MLIALVIFMVAVPILVATEIGRPKYPAKLITQPTEPLIVTLAGDSGLFVRSERVDPSSLAPRLQALRSAEGSNVIYVRADKEVSCESLSGLLHGLQASGFQRVSLLS
jgi:biopolymer transport protein TolR